MLSPGCFSVQPAAFTDESMVIHGQIAAKPWVNLTEFIVANHVLAASNG
jgi:hypothetical protein